MDSKMTAALDLVRREAGEPLARFADIVRSVRTDFFPDLREAVYTSLALLKHLYLNEGMEAAFKVACTHDLAMCGRYDVGSWRNLRSMDGATRLVIKVVEADEQLQYQLRAMVDALKREGFTVDISDLLDGQSIPAALPPLVDLQAQFEESEAKPGKISITVERK